MIKMKFPEKSVSNGKVGRETRPDREPAPHNMMIPEYHYFCVSSEGGKLAQRVLSIVADVEWANI